MDTTLYIQLTLLFAFQYAIWGAWCPVLAARLLGPLRMSGKQTGWIYATLPIASFVSPFLFGYLADEVVDPKWLLVGCHLCGAILLFVAAKQEKFVPLFVVMLGFAFFYGATLPLVNAFVIRNAGEDATKVFIWAPIAWAGIGYLLSGWRSTRKTESDGKDCLILAGMMAIIMVVVCAIQPGAEPTGGGKEGGALGEAFKMLLDPSFAIFVIVQFIGAAVMQFYFLGTAQFMQDKGLQGKHVPGAMAIAQVAQAVTTYFFLAYYYFVLFGPTWTITIGAASWLFLFLVYVFLAQRGIIVASQSLHGVAYVFFIICGWMYVGDYASKDISNSAQALIAVVQNGVGLFLGTQVAGIVMDRNSVGGKFQWKKIFSVPLLAMVLAIVLMLFVKDPPKKATAAEKLVVETKASDAADQPPVEKAEE